MSGESIIMMNAFEAAKNKFLSSLSAQEAATLGSPHTAEDVLTEVRSAEENHRNKSTTRRYTKRIEPFLKGVEQYGKAIDVFVNVYPEALSVIWGSARLILHLAIEFIDFFEKLVDMFRRLGKSLGRFEIYARLYPTSGRLKESLVDAYEKFLDLCLKSKSVFAEKSPKRFKWLSSSSAVVGIKLLWKPIKVKLESTLDELDELLEDVEKEADVAEKVESGVSRLVINNHVSGQQKREVFDWLGPVDPSINHLNAVKLHEPGTGEWIFDHEKYKEWESKENAALWIHAKPGAGKTILVSTIINHITNNFENDSTVTVCYFYCDYKDVQKRSPRKVLGTLISEICRKNSEALEYVDYISSKFRESKSSCTVQTLFSILEKCLGFQQETFVIIDALDECDGREDLLHFLVDLSKSGLRLRLLLASRNERDIQQELGSLPQVTISDIDSAPDIELFIHSSLNAMIKSKKLKLRDETLRLEIFECLCSRADGMFQWVKCQLDALCAFITDKSIRKSLEQLPKGLDETYVRAFSKIRNDMGEDAVMIRRIFHWLVHSKRPLTLRELSEAVSIDFRQTWLDFSAIPTDPEDIFRFCGGLVTLSGHDDEETVNLSHFSIKEFLLSSRIKETEVSEFYAGSSNALFDIAGACLTYIMLDDFDEGQCLNVSKMMQRKVEYAFLNYAALYWHDHYELLKSKEAEMLEDSGFAFFTGPDHSRSLESWFQLSKEVEEKEDKHRYGTTVNYSEYWENRRERKQTLVASCPAMYHAARLGLSGLVKRLIVNGYDVNAKAQIDFGKYDYPIIVAASGKHWTTVDLLIDAGASLNVTSRQGDVLSALARACTPEIWWLIKKVLDKGGWQLLQESTTAFRYDSKITQMSVLSTLALHPLDASEMVELFIKSGADVNDWLDSGVIENLMKVKESAQYSSPPLQRAAFQGNNRVLEVLVKAGAWINFSYGELGSPLQAATRGNRESTILRLLELDADINAKGGALGTPLQAAAWNGNVRIMTLLLNHGADVDVEGGLYGCALNAATQQKHKDAVELLLSKGANINQFCASGNAPRNTTTVERGSKPANGLAYGLLSNENFCETPLNNAIVAEDMSIVTLMLAAGACLLQDDKRCTFPTHSLCQAILMENVDMVDLLLRNGASVEVGNYCALVKAAAQSSFSILKLLFDQIEGDTSKMNSAMSDVIGQIEDETVARDFIPILERMFARNESDSQSSLVIETVNNGCFALTEFLLKHGLTPNIARRYSDDQNFGQFSKGTPLSIAILKDRMDLFSLLLHYGVDVNLADERPVHGSGSSDTRASYMYRPVRSSESLHMLGSPLFVAVQSGNVEAVSRLLVQGALPNVDTCAGGKCSNVVHLAASNHDPGMLEELLKYGANPTTSCYTCPSALMAAVKSQSLDEILMLVRKGADINEPDLFGRTPFSRAKDSCLEDATKTLLELQAEDAIPLERLCSRLEKSVELLVSKLLQPLDPGWDLGIGSHFPWTLWIHLGRCLNLGNDSQNGIIALEQILCSFEKYEGYPDSESSVGWRSRLRCCYCYEWELLYVLDSPQLHLCEDCCDGVFCEDCVERHQLLYRNSTYSHSVTDFPRQLFRDAPEGQLALDEKTYLPVQVWLEGLRGWTAKLCVIESKGEDCIQ